MLKSQNTHQITKGKTHTILRLIGCCLPIMLLGFLSGLSTSKEIETWYSYLQKPSFNPPNYLFGPVWSLLYLLMGISLSIIIGNPSSQVRKISIILFAIQFTLNLCWSYIFFNLHSTGWAFIEIILMWLFILSMIISFYRVNKTAGILQIPYLIWVSFASILNYNIYILN